MVHICIQYMKELGLKFCNEHAGVINKQMTDSCHLQSSISPLLTLGDGWVWGDLGLQMYIVIDLQE